VRGDQFDSMEQFINAFEQGVIGPLDAKADLGRLYTTAQLADVARALEGRRRGGAIDAFGAPTDRRSRGAVYERVERLVDFVDDNKALGKALLGAEHDYVYPVLSYRQMANWPVNSAQGYREWLVGQGEWPGVDRNYETYAEPLTKPPSWHPRLESVYFPSREDRVSMVYAQSRVMWLPDHGSYDHTGMFVARIPIVLNLLFNHRIVEVAMPAFAEPTLGYHDSDNPQSFPGRAFRSLGNVWDLFQKGARVPSPGKMTRIKGDSLLLYLEQQCGAKDFGWDIERVADGGKLNTKQPARIPLKGILDTFMSELAAKCKAGGFKNPLQGRNVYNIFRTIKSESHTLSMVLGVPRKGGGDPLQISGFFGAADAGSDGIYDMIGSDFSEIDREGIRDAVAKLRVTKLDDPYSINNFEKIV
jgi:hypothetical protein